jgi:hypothetical protein
LETESQVATGSLKAGDVRNKFDIRFTDLSITKGAKEYRVKANKGQKIVTKGLQTGQFTAPISETVWPEVNVPGTPWPQVPFQLFGNLKDGFVMDNKQWGQLKPWPGAPVPAPSKVCTGNELGNPSPSPVPSGQVPIANAGTNLTGQLAGALITLTGSNTNAALTDSQLTFSWSGPADVTITNANQAVMSFVNPWQDPTSTPTTTRTFTLKICLASDNTQCSTASVSVVTDKFVDTITITGYQYNTKQGGTITVSATSNNVLVGTNGANLQLQLSGTGAWLNMAQDTGNNANTGRYTFNKNAIGRQPTSIGVRSSHNPTPVTTTAFIKRALRTIWRT